MRVTPLGLCLRIIANENPLNIEKTTLQNVEDFYVRACNLLFEVPDSILSRAMHTDTSKQDGTPIESSPSCAITVFRSMLGCLESWTGQSFSLSCDAIFIQILMPNF